MSSEAADQSVFPLFLSRRVRTAPPSEEVLSAEPSDEDLLLRMEAGDCHAVELLFDRYASLVFGIGLRILHQRNEAEDFVQDIFLQLFARVRGFDASKGPGRSWIVQIAYRRAFDRLAYLKKHHAYDGTDIERVQNNLVGDLELEEQIADLLTGEQLHAAFNNLSDKQRTTLELFFFEGLDLREICERTGETLENTRHFYYRGLWCPSPILRTEVAFASVRRASGREVPRRASRCRL